MYIYKQVHIHVQDCRNQSEKPALRDFIYLFIFKITIDQGNILTRNFGKMFVIKCLIQFCTILVLKIIFLVMLIKFILILLK